MTLGDILILESKPAGQQCATGEYAVITDLEIRALDVQSAFNCEGVGQTVEDRGDYNRTTYGQDIAGLTQKPYATSCFNIDAADRVPGLGDPSRKRIVEAITCLSTVQSCNIYYRIAFDCIALPTYSWVTSAWSECSATTCSASGTQTRTVTCSSSDRSSALPTDCTTTAPVTSQSCQASACSSTAGPAGNSRSSAASFSVNGFISAFLIAAAAAATQFTN